MVAILRDLIETLSTKTIRILVATVTTVEVLITPLTTYPDLDYAAEQHRG